MWKKTLEEIEILLESKNKQKLYKMLQFEKFLGMDEPFGLNNTGLAQMRATVSKPGTNQSELN